MRTKTNLTCPTCNKFLYAERTDINKPITEHYDNSSSFIGIISCNPGCLYIKYQMLCLEKTSDIGLVYFDKIFKLDRVHFKLNEDDIYPKLEIGCDYLNKDYNNKLVSRFYRSSSDFTEIDHGNNLDTIDSFIEYILQFKTLYKFW